MSTSLRAGLVALLEADATLLATATGGVYDTREINRTSTPDAYDSTTGLIKPCCVVVMSTPIDVGPHPDYRMAQEFFFVYYYSSEADAYASIDAMRERVRALIHQQRIATVDVGTVWEMRWADGIGDQYDEVLRASMSYDRFWAWRQRT
jgi:hypothetical protein